MVAGDGAGNDRVVVAVVVSVVVCIIVDVVDVVGFVSLCACRP